MRSAIVWGWMACLLLLGACKSARHTAGGNDLSGAEGERFVAGIIANAPACRAVNGKMRFTLTVGDKELSVGGNLRMLKDDVIQLSLVGLGIVEGGRIEFTRDEVLVLDRMNRQYARIPYTQLRFLKEAGIDFYTLQALFWNELILPGRHHVTDTDLSAFAVRKEATQAVLAGTPSNGLAYRFFVALVTGALEKTEISARAPYRMEWSYADFTEVDGKPFPTQMNIRIDGLKKRLAASIRLTRIGTEADWETRTRVSKRYRAVTADEILERLTQLQ